jgi:hypothetical protein
MSWSRYCQASATADLLNPDLVIHVQNTPDMNEMEGTQPIASVAGRYSKWQHLPHYPLPLFPHLASCKIYIDSGQSNRL